MLDNELCARVEMDSFPTQQQYKVAFVNPLVVLQTSNVHPGSPAITNSANLFATVTQIVPQTSFASKMCVKRSAEKMETVIQMKFVKAFIV